MDKSSLNDFLYDSPQIKVADFVFDESVAGVFDDMINRSVPGYKAIITMIGVLAGEYVKADSHCYDLGCSLGAATLSMRRHIKESNVCIITVDNSPAMIERCRQNVEQDRGDVPVDIRCDDIRAVKIERASMVVLNFTLQFIDRDQRQDLVETIYNGLSDGGIFIMSDKIAFDNPQEQKTQDALHHTFKKLHRYSDLEIAQKRAALENVLLPDTLDTHQERLQTVGFKRSHVWFQCFNFASMIAFK